MASFTSGGRPLNSVVGMYPLTASEPNDETMSTLARLVQIEWVDSRQPTAAWQRVSDLDHLREGRCTSVGFLIRETKDVKVLACSIADHDDDPQAAGVFVIPTAAVLSQRALTASSTSGGSASVSNRKPRPSSRGG